MSLLRLRSDASVQRAIPAQDVEPSTSARQTHGADPLPRAWPATSQTTRSKGPSRGLGSFFAGSLRPAVAAVMLGAGFMLAGAGAQAQTINVQDVPALEQPAATTPVRAALARLLAADADGDGRIVGRTWGNELGSIDPLAKAVYDYVDYINPRATTSLWGLESRGDYLEGGLGLGYSFRPKHMTGHSILLAKDLEAGAQSLEARLAAAPSTDQPSKDIDAILAKMSPELSTREKLAKVHAAAERLLDHALDETEKLEIATGNSSAVLSDSALIASLPEGSLERTIAETAAGHGLSHFSDQIHVITNRAHALGGGSGHEATIKGEAQQNYLLLIAKRAKEGQLVLDVKAHLP